MLDSRYSFVESELKFFYFFQIWPVTMCAFGRASLPILTRHEGIRLRWAMPASPDRLRHEEYSHRFWFVLRMSYVVYRMSLEEFISQEKAKNL